VRLYPASFVSVIVESRATNAGSVKRAKRPEHRENGARYNDGPADRMRALMAVAPPPPTLAHQAERGQKTARAVQLRVKLSEVICEGGGAALPPFIAFRSFGFLFPSISHSASCILQLFIPSTKRIRSLFGKLHRMLRIQRPGSLIILQALRSRLPDVSSCRQTPQAGAFL